MTTTTNSGEFKMEYRFRNLPCRLSTGRELRWHVAGGFTDEHGRGGGVLEWCYSEEDANTMMSKMSRDPHFTNLSVGYWKGE